MSLKPYGGNRLHLLAGTEYFDRLERLPNDDILHQLTDDRECPLCRHPYETGGQNPVILDCGHICCECIEEWLPEVKSKKDSCPVCRQPLFATLTDDMYRRRLRLVYHAVDEASVRGVRSDVELYEALRLRGSTLEPRNPPAAPLSEEQEREMFYDLLHNHTFVFRIPEEKKDYFFQSPEEKRDSPEFIVRYSGQYYGLLNITGLWNNDHVTKFPKRLARFSLQKALNVGEDLKRWRYVVQEFLDRDVARELDDPDLDPTERPIDEDMIREVLDRHLPSRLPEQNFHLNPDLVDRNLVQFALDRDLLQDYIGRKISRGIADMEWAKGLAERFSMRLDGLEDLNDQVARLCRSRGIDANDDTF